MRLDLREIIDMPGASLSFVCELDSVPLKDESITAFTTAPRCEGRIVNSAGALTLTGRLEAGLIRVCDRCGKEFEAPFSMELELPLAADVEDSENPDVFTLDGDFIDLDEVLSTVFILNCDTKSLCSEDCAGLCEKCGADLNLGSCGCAKQNDPRMAVLEQLLDSGDNTH